MIEPQHPITPPPELVQQWEEDWNHNEVNIEFEPYIAARAAQWGADQELEACVEWLQDPDLNVDTYKLRAARRPKLPSLKEQTMRVLVENGTTLDGRMELEPEDIDTIRRALEALPDD